VPRTAPSCSGTARVDRLVVGEAFDVNRVIERFDDFRHLVDQVESQVAGHRIAAAEQQTGVEFDLDPQLVAAHGHLLGRDQITERRVDVIGDGFQRVLSASAPTLRRFCSLS
jgi:hypothetical protein